MQSRVVSVTPNDLKIKIKLPKRIAMKPPSLKIKKQEKMKELKRWPLSPVVNSPTIFQKIDGYYIDEQQRKGVEFLLNLGRSLADFNDEMDIMSPGTPIEVKQERFLKKMKNNFVSIKVYPENEQSYRKTRIFKLQNPILTLPKSFTVKQLVALLQKKMNTNRHLIITHNKRRLSNNITIGSILSSYGISPEELILNYAAA